MDAAKYYRQSPQQNTIDSPGETRITKESLPMTLKLVSGYLIRRILKFSIQMYMENKPWPQEGGGGGGGP